MGSGPQRGLRALDARLDAVLAELAASGEIADHCAPRHRAWVADVAQIYFGDPDGLPDELRARIGSETAVAHLGDGVTNKARAAALVDRARRPTGDPSSSVRAGFAVDSTAPNRQRIPVGESLANPHRTAPDLAPSRRRGRVLAAVALVALVAAATAAIQAGADDEDPTTARRTGAVATASAPDTAVVALGRVRGPDDGGARRSIGRDGEPTGEWARLSATGVVDIDMAANLDGRLEIGGVTERGTAFNVWQSEPPDGWSAFSDDRGGEDGVRAQLVANDDGRLELFVERADGELWNTWQVAQGRGWTDPWDTRHFTGVRDWRVAVGAEGRLVAVALTPDGAVVRTVVNTLLRARSSKDRDPGGRGPGRPMRRWPAR